MAVVKPFEWECEGCGIGYDGPESGYCSRCGTPRPGEVPATEERSTIIVSIELVADTAAFERALRAWRDVFSQKGISTDANR